VVTIFALASALFYGCADFLGGVATRHARVLSVLPLSAGAGAIIGLAAALISGQPIHLSGLGWGIAGGAVGGLGLIVFYAGLAAGPMSVVAPVSALVATILPVGVAFAGGERAGPKVYLGALLCLVAIVLVSSAAPPETAHQRRPTSSELPAESQDLVTSPTPGLHSATATKVLARNPATQLTGRLNVRGFHLRAVAYGAVAGATFGLFFVFLRNAGHTGTLWPITAARLAGLAVILLAAAVTRTRPVLSKVSRRLLLAIIGSGVLDASANLLYVIATRSGLFGLAVVLTSLYPGVTVLLARVTLGERLRPTQRFGLVLAGIGVVLVTI